MKEKFSIYSKTPLQTTNNTKAVWQALLESERTSIKQGG